MCACARVRVSAGLCVWAGAVLLDKDCENARRCVKPMASAARDTHAHMYDDKFFLGPVLIAFESTRE